MIIFKAFHQKTGQVLDEDEINTHTINNNKNKTKQNNGSDEEQSKHDKEKLFILTKLKILETAAPDTDQ